MPTELIRPPFPQFRNAAGAPLNNGYVYFGTAGSDPVNNQITVYWDRALTIPAAQPIRTVNGYLSRGGSPARVFTNVDYSVQSQDAGRSVVYTSLSNNVDSIGETFDAASITYNQGGTGAVDRTQKAKNQEFVSVDDFEGVDNTGSTDSKAGVEAAFAVSRNIRFTPGKTYLISSGRIDVAYDNVNVIARGATIIIDGSPSGFSFGSPAADSEPNHSGFTWDGGTFQNADGTDVVDRSYIQVSGINNFRISNVTMEEVSNGGIVIRSGCRNGLIEGINIPTFSSNTTRRGIWLNGSDATDYQSDLVDFSSITRNGNALPVGGIRDVTIRKCSIVGQYNIYLMNARGTTIEDCDLDASTQGLRCITINTYSPHTKVVNNRLNSSASVGNTGIMATQFSHDIHIRGNTFTGDFGNGRDIYIRYLAEAVISENTFETGTTIQILSEMGGNGKVHDNRFGNPVETAKTSGDRCMRIYTIGNSEVSLSGYGDTATVVKGWIFENNEIYTRNAGVQLTQQADSDTGNEVGIELVSVRSNTFFNWNDVSNSDEYPLKINSIASPANNMYYLCVSNLTSPAGNGFEERNKADDSNGAAINILSTNQNSEYGEGLWTPTVQDSSLSDAEGQTYSLQTGRWYRRGRFVTVQGVLTVSSLGTLTTSNAVAIAGLPFTSKTVASFNWSGDVGAASGLSITAGHSLTCYAPSNVSYLRIGVFDATTGTTPLLLSELTSSGSISFNATYEIASL